MFEPKDNNLAKNLMISAGVISLVILLVIIFVPISYRNSVADAERLVVQSKDNCASTYDNGINSIIEMANVDVNTKQFLKDFIKSASGDQKQQVDSAYGEFVNGNPTPFLLLLNSIAGTNITATATNVQREINAQRAAMLTCSTTLNGALANLKDALGMGGSTEVIMFPQTLMHIRATSVSDATLRDNDGDGRLTVLDYRPPVNVNISSKFGTGEGVDPVNPYDTSQP